MNRFTKYAVVVALLGLAVSAHAVPKIDPALTPFLTSSFESNQPVKIVAMFKDKMPLPRTEHNTLNRGQVEIALRQNAKASQIGTFKSLGRIKDSGGVMHFQSFWLLNAAVIELPASEVKTLAQNEDILALYANHAAHIVGATPVHTSASSAGAPTAYTYGLNKINLPQLRAKAPTLNGAGVRVGILDTGIDATHPDLQGRVTLFKDFINNKAEPYDDHSHGTHVAGTISGGFASGTNIGIAPGVKLIVGKIFTSSGSGSYEGIFKGMQWIADPDGNPNTNDQPMLVSNSWGGGAPSASKDPMDEPLCKAVAGWVKLGILPVFAAGNSGPSAGSVGLPGACPQSLTLGATDDKDAIASFSSRGPVKWKSGSIVKPTVSAPGVNVISSVPNGGYKAFSGTSMATPHAAGLAALIYQAAPKSTVEEVIKLMVAGAKPMGSGMPNNDFGAGRIDAVTTIKTLVNLMHQGGGSHPSTEAAR